MAIVNTKEMLKDAKLNHYAIGAFNIENMEFAQAIIWAAAELNSPIILQTSENTLKYGTPELFRAIVDTIAKDVNIPVAIHLDHGTSFKSVERCVYADYRSVMFDGSMMCFKDNVETTARLVKKCRPRGISVEAELGAISGKEGAPSESTDLYTDPQTAVEFVETTGINSLAVSIGTVHGLYKTEPKLDYERLKTINDMVSVPLVLHGASGLDDNQLRKCIELGISKINIATDLRIGWTEALKKYNNENPTVFDPKKAAKTAREAVMQIVKERITVLGSVDRG